MTPEQKAALDESMALAEKMQNDEDLAAATAEISNEDTGGATEEKEEPKQEPITQYVKQEMVKQIMEMGFG